MKNNSICFSIEVKIMYINNGRKLICTRLWDE